MSKKNQYKPEFKSKVILEVLKEEKSINEIASNYQVSPSMISKWRKIFKENIDKVFMDGNKEYNKMKADYENQIESLYKQIGEITTQLNWLKKKCSV